MNELFARLLVEPLGQTLTQPARVHEDDRDPARLLRQRSRDAGEGEVIERLGTRGGLDGAGAKQ